MDGSRNIIPVHPTPVEPRAQKLPPLIAKTMNVCVNCVQAPGRMVAKAATRRYHKHYHPRHRFGRHHLVADIAFAAAIVVLFGVNAWFILGKPVFLPSNVRLAWEAPTTARVGDAVSLALTVAYEGNEPLDRATLALIPPDGFAVIRVTPGTYDDTTHTLTLPAPIAPGASIGVTVDAVVEPPSDRDLALTATFHGAGALGSERQSAKTMLAVQGVAIVFELEAPPIVPANGVVGLNLRYHSEAVVPLRDIVLRPALSNPFALEGADPWSTPRDIAPDARGELGFEVRTKEAGTFLLDTTVFQQPRNGASTALGGFASPLTVRDVPVQFTFGMNGDGPLLTRRGESEGIGASYRGVPDSAIEVFQVRITGPLVHTSRITTAEDLRHYESIGWDLRGQATTATAHTTATEIGFILVPPAQIASTDYGEDTRFAYTMTPIAWLKFGKGFGEKTSARIEGTPLVLDVAGDLNLSSSARYFTPEGDQIGRGPLPPRVGETTRYWVTWDLRATIQNAGRTVVRATLPPGVEWSNHVATTAGDGVAYDAATRIVTWAVNDVPRTIGSTYPNVSASFELALTPDAGMVGRPAGLLGESVAEGTDALGTPLRVLAPAVTTELLQDARARGKGRVE